MGVFGIPVVGKRALGLSDDAGNRVSKGIKEGESGPGKDGMEFGLAGKRGGTEKRGGPTAGSGG